MNEDLSSTEPFNATAPNRCPQSGPRQEQQRSARLQMQQQQQQILPPKEMGEQRRPALAFTQEDRDFADALSDLRNVRFHGLV